MLLESLVVFSSLARLVLRVWCRVPGAVSVPVLRFVSDGRVEHMILVHHLAWLLAAHPLMFKVTREDELTLLGHCLRISLQEGSCGTKDVAHWALVLVLRLRDSVVRLVDILFGLS